MGPSSKCTSFERRIAGLWQTSVHSDAAFWFFDVGSFSPTLIIVQGRVEMLCSLPLPWSAYFRLIIAGRLFNSGHILTDMSFSLLLFSLFNIHWRRLAMFLDSPKLNLQRRDLLWSTWAMNHSFLDSLVSDRVSCRAGMEVWWVNVGVGGQRKREPLTTTQPFILSLFFPPPKIIIVSQQPVWRHGMNGNRPDPCSFHSFITHTSMHSTKRTSHATLLCVAVSYIR